MNSFKIENERDLETLAWLEYKYTTEELKCAKNAILGQRKAYLSNVIKILKAEVPEEIKNGQSFEEWKASVEIAKQKILGKI